MKGILICIVALLILSACYHSDESSQIQSTAHKSEVAQTTNDNKIVMPTNWILFRGENDNEPIEYLENMDDLNGDDIINTDSIIDKLYVSEKGDYPKDELYINGISFDGSHIILCRESHDSNYLMVKIFDLSTLQKTIEFNIPVTTDYFLISPDLKRCVYAENGVLYQYIIKEKSAKKLADLYNHVTGFANLKNPKFSPDSMKLCLQSNRYLVFYDLVNNKKVKQVSMGTEGIWIEQWLYNDLLLYSSSSDNKTYLLDLKNGNKRVLADVTGSLTLTMDGKRMVYLNSQKEIEQHHINTGQSVKYFDVMQRLGYSVAPVQWIQTTTDLMKYRKSIPAQKIVASSTLPDQAGNSYAARNIMDGDASTAWCEGVKGDGIGEWIKIDFGSMQELKGVELINGLAKSSKAFQANNRVKRMKLEFSNGQTMMVDNDFIRNEFLDNPIHTSFVKITIEAVERGTKYHDTCMSEIRFF
ncbi:hypothetical protein C1I59_23220 [Paenibacillus polymyxa]|uniref:NADase-type glycan-binding domain-containing protein n=1 Tax=Paenibacillus polymyxa TaxID=1406 RepID=UPI0010BE27EC|nr:discoidin domain-containing protein [Paenibacillus polymyxa]TKH33325.1 hypothetical protein C1I59_23220 [Paenibacillus polymyxa]